MNNNEVNTSTPNYTKEASKVAAIMGVCVLWPSLAKGNMKKNVILLLVLLLFGPQNVAAETVRLTEHVDEKGKRTIYNTTKDTIEKSPSWNLDQEPPLSVHKAVAIAKQWVKTKHPKFDSFSIITISLSKIGDYRYQNKWYYSVSIDADIDLNGVRATSYFSVVILMDGTVIEPKSAKSNE